MTKLAKDVADQIAIRSVLAEYCLRLDLDSFEHWLDLFTDDTEYEVFRRTLRGRAEVSAMLSQAPHGVHIGGPARIELAGDEVETVQKYFFFADDDQHSNTGWYYRTLTRTADGWKIARTRVAIHKRRGYPPQGERSRSRYLRASPRPSRNPNTNPYLSPTSTLSPNPSRFSQYAPQPRPTWTRLGC